MSYKNSIIVVLIALSLHGISSSVFRLLTRRAYPVHEQGAVLISGASKGIGKHAALFLAEKGFTVYAGVRNDKDGKLLKKESTGDVKPILLDVTKSKQIDEAVAKISKDLESSNESLIGVINNAGIMYRELWETQPMEHMRKLFDVNVLGAVELTQACLPLLKKSKGRIINIGSIAGFTVTPFMTVYSGSKFALRGISEGLRRELSHFDISVSLIETGIVKTDLNGLSGIDNVTDPSKKAEYEDLLAMNGMDYNQLAWEKSDVSPSIHQALTEKYPKTSYQCAGLGPVSAGLLKTLVNVIPERWIDLRVSVRPSS